MKMRSFRNMALMFAMATMASTSAVFANCHHECDHHHHHREGTTVEQVRAVEIPGVLAFNALLGNLNDIIVFQASRNIALGGVAASRLVEPNLSFINAELGAGFGGSGAVILQLSQLLSTIGVPSANISVFAAATAVFNDAGVNYSNAVATNQTALVQAGFYEAWRVAGVAWAESIIALGHFGETLQNEILAQVDQIRINQGQAVVGFNTSSFVAAVSDDAAAHANVSRVAEILFERLLRDCHRVF